MKRAREKYKKLKDRVESGEVGEIAPGPHKTRRQQTQVFPIWMLILSTSKQCHSTNASHEPHGLLCMTEKNPLQQWISDAST